MTRVDYLFDGFTFFLQYIDRPKVDFFEDIRLIKKHRGFTTRFPLNTPPTHVVVDLPGCPRFHTYSLPAHLPSRSDTPPTWSLDQIMDYFTGIGADDRVVVVQRQWITDCIRQGKVLGAREEWGGWRLRRATASPSSSCSNPESPKLLRRLRDPSPPNKRKQDCKRTRLEDGSGPDWEAYWSRTRAERPSPSGPSSAASPSQKQLLTPREFRERKVSNSHDETLAERMRHGRSRSPHSPVSLAERMSADAGQSLRNRMSGFKPIAETTSRPSPALFAASALSPAPAGSGPQSGEACSPNATATSPSAGALSEADVPAVLDTPKTSCDVMETGLIQTDPATVAFPSAPQADTVHEQPHETVRSPLVLTTAPPVVDRDSENKERQTSPAEAASTQEIETAFAHIKDPRVRLPSIKAAKEGRILLPTSQASGVPSATEPAEQPTSPEKLEPTTDALSEKSISPIEAEEVEDEVVHVAPVDAASQPDDTLVTAAAPADPRREPGLELVIDTAMADNNQVSISLPSEDTPLHPGVVEESQIQEDNSADCAESMVADVLMDVEQQVEAVLQANQTLGSPPPIQRTAAPVRPGGVFELFSFGLTHPFSFFVTEGTEPGIPRMISLAGGKNVSLERARFVIVPGSVGTALSEDLVSLADGEGIWPGARVVHEQWIKHCFRDECILCPDDYLAHPPLDAGTTPEGKYRVKDDEVADPDAPPKDALVRIGKIIEAIRDWKEGRAETGFKTVYNFVDNLSRTRGIKNSAGLYRQHRAYIARVAPDVARPPK